jgi:hypothetical protein
MMVATKSRDLWEMYSSANYNARAYARLKGLWVTGYTLHYNQHYEVVMTLTTPLNYIEPSKSSLLRRADNEFNIQKKYGNVKLFVNHVNRIDTPTQEMIRALDMGHESKIDINVILKKNPDLRISAVNGKLWITDYPFILFTDYPKAMLEINGKTFEKAPAQAVPIIRTA